MKWRMLNKIAFDKLINDLIEHSTYFEYKWQLDGVSRDCWQAANELQNMRAKLEIALGPEATAALQSDEL